MTDLKSTGLDFPEPDYDHLLFQETDSSDCCKVASHDEDVPIKKGKTVPNYILGTLVIRIVAARDLEPTDRGFGQMVLGRSPRRAGGGGTANPYASVKFGNTTQRTSEVFDALDPIWPRQEAMFMDVSLPRSELTLPQESTNEGTSASNDSPDQSAASLSTDTSIPAPKVFKRPNAVLSVALFHASEIGKTHKYPTKGGGGYSGDSDDSFLGMATVDLTQLFTGLRQNFDEWLPLSGTEHSRGTVRVVCEYEPSDAPPRVGDFCRFTSFCHPADLFPLTPGNCYQVAEVDGDNVVLSYESPEGWVCSFQAHRYMLLCEERHHGAVEFCQDELASVTERLTHSPMVRSVTETVERVAVDGLLSVGNDVVHGGLSLFGRWLDGGLETALSDVAHATNWDGRYNPNTVDSLESPSTVAPAVLSDDPIVNEKPAVQEEERVDSTAVVTKDATPLPNMPSCPITGEPMIDPVVAADGHTYERSAIARWLQTSDKSPLSGSLLPHKDLVPNYVLLSSLQEAATRMNEADGSQTDSDGSGRTETA